MIERLIGRYVRYLNERLMNFEASPEGVALPAPDLTKRHLLYLHVPFCVVLCPFCPFHRVEFKEQRALDYFDALDAEIEAAARFGFRFRELYVGGGTPTVLPQRLVRTINRVAAAHQLTGISVETNPHDLDEGKMAGLAEAGVTRLSVGVQSLDDNLLKEMQRYQKYGSSTQIREHLKRVMGTFPTLNVDMIFNFPHQTVESLDEDLKILTDEICVDQVSWYPLMTAGATRRSMQRELGIVDYDREKALYERISRHMLRAGYSRSSAWCFSRQPGMFDEYIVEHDEYLGLGSGAFSYLSGALYANTFSINNYLRLVAARGSSCVRERRLSEIEQMRYYLLMKLFGGTLELAAAEKRFNGRFESSLRHDISGLRLIGAIRKEAGGLLLTERGNYLWVILMREFFTGVNNFRDDMRHHISKEARRISSGFG